MKLETRVELYPGAVIAALRPAENGTRAAIHTSMTTKPQAQTLFYFHVHNGKGDHAGGEDYEIVIVCEEHRAAVEADEDAEFITETTDEEESCDKCGAALKGKDLVTKVEE